MCHDENGHHVSDNLIGQRFGRLTVVERAGRTKLGSVLWQCQCSCGKEQISTTTQLRRKTGPTRSCGCLQPGIAATIRNPLSARDQLFGAYRSWAKKAGRVFELTLEQFTVLTQGNCVYCGLGPSSIFHKRRTGKRNQLGDFLPPYKYNGIDRVDNTVGYVVSNCVSCCYKCNHAKATMSKGEFIEWIYRIYEYLESQ